MSRLQRTISLLLLIGTCKLAVGQSNPYNEVSIASPTAASLGKFADVPVNYHTGIPNINIPIYTIQEGTLKLLIGLSYHAGGLKVMEPASWVGAGWALNAGGVITRTVQGAPDERQTSGSHSQQMLGHLSDKGYNNYLWYKNTGNPNTPVFLKDIASGAADGEPDLFFFNFGGHSGKFYFGDDQVPVILPQQDLKIEYVYTPGLFKSIDKFVITTSDGIKYFFGKTDNPSDTDPIEIPLSYTASNGPAVEGRSISSWYLNKIQSADDVFQINLTYQPEKYSYYTISMFPIDYNENIKNGCDITKVFIEGVRLSSITFSNGSVNFIPGQVRTDLNAFIPRDITDVVNTESVTLGEVQITNNVGNCKKMIFNYDYFVDNITPLTGLFLSNVETDKKRLKLLSVQEKSCDNTETIPPYIFDYHTELVPRRLSFAQDHWGFYNGASNTGTLIPTYIESPIQQVTGANRDSKWPDMRGGTLKKITYPTGGYAAFEYEANTTWLSYNKYTFTYAFGSSVGYDGSTSSNQNATFSGNSYTVKLSNSSCPPNTSSCSVALTIFNSSNQSVFGMSASAGEQKTAQVILPAGPYRIYMSRTAAATGNGASSTFHEMATVPYSENTIIGGLRVKTITTHDGIKAENDIITNYSYWENNGNTRTSGILYSRPTYVQTLKNSGPRYIYQTLLFQGATWYLDAEKYPLEHPYFTLGARKALKSPVAILPMSTTQGNHVGYNEVKVSQTGNGYSIYRYYGSNIWDNDHSDVAIRIIDRSSVNPAAPEYPAAPLPFEYKRGQLKYEAQFNEAGKMLRELTYIPVYENSIVTTPGVKVYSENSGPPSYMYTSARTNYEFQSAKLTQMTMVENIFDQTTNDYLTTTATTLFESSQHNQPTAEKNTNSKGLEVISKTKYAFDFVPLTCINIDNCWNTYQTTLQNNLSLYSTENNACTSDDCRAIARYTYNSRNAQARRDYGSCRIQKLADFNTCFATAKASADRELKPILELGSKHINTPIETTQWKNGKLHSAKFNKYAPASSPSGHIYPAKSLSINLGAPITNFTQSSLNANSLIIDNRYRETTNTKFLDGNMTEVNTREGFQTAYIWGVNNTQPVVKALGINRSTLLAAYNAVGGNLSQLRTHSLLANARIITYTYTPLVGTISETNENGRTIYYEYDKLFRLVRIRDKDNNILKQFTYQYQQQQ
jgi:YD repeat-containing protein